MYNLHTHSLLSDGVLLPSELAVRYGAIGYKAIAITDHVDYSNIKSVVNSIREFCRHWPKNSKIKVLPGVELTHLPLEQFRPLAKFAREKGIKVIVAHGQTLAEPVAKGTNLAALKADIDILSHPGLITDEETKLAKKRNIFLEITTRGGHSDANAHVVERALKLGARLILNSDSHAPEDIVEQAYVEDVARKAGLSASEIRKIYQDMRRFVEDGRG